MNNERTMIIINLTVILTRICAVLDFGSDVFHLEGNEFNKPHSLNLFQGFVISRIGSNIETFAQ